MKDMVAEAVRDRDNLVHDIQEKNYVLQITLDKTFGLTHRQELVPDPHGFLRVTQGAALPPGRGFSGLAEAYVAFTGDSEFQRVGKGRISQLSTPDFPSALANTLNSLLVRDFAVEYRWRDLVTEFTSPENFRPQDRVRIGYVEDLPEVGEDAPYDEIQSHSDEGYTLSVIQKGGMLTITRRVLINDNIGAVKRLVEQAGRAAWRTLAKRVWNLVISNATYGGDGLPIFHGNHGNLGSAALSVSSLTAARNAIFAQKEPGSAERLGLSGPFLLAVPIELESTALPINSCEYIPESATYEGNPWKGRFGANSERIFANPLMTDPTDWLMFDVSGNVGIIEVGFLMGGQNPEIIVANNEKGDGTFYQDRIIYRVRHEFEAVIRDYRGAYKAVVT